MQSQDLSFDYDAGGASYSQYRREDPRIAQQIRRALGDAHTLLNVGAGAGSYEPTDCRVVAVEPSRTMRLQRIAAGRVPAVAASAEELPFDEDSFDASLAVLTIHHWPDPAVGLEELRRVTRRRIVIVTYDPDALDVFWNTHYFREVVETERKRYPPIATIVESLGGKASIDAISIPFDCSDGFQEAFYGRPEAFLDVDVRKNQSAWRLVDSQTERQLIESFARSLSSGEWDRRFGHHRRMPTFTGALRIVAADGEARRG